MKKYFFLVFVIGLFSCQKELDFKIEDDEKKIVVNSVINPDSLIKINLSKSLGVLEDDNNFTFIENATIKLYEDDIFIENLIFDNNKYSYYSTIYPKIEKTYKIEAEVQYMDKISATTNILEPFPILSIDLSQLRIIDEAFDEDPESPSQTILGTINVEIENQVDIENYFIISFYQLDTAYYFDTINFVYTDSIIGFSKMSYGYEATQATHAITYEYYYNSFLSGLAFSDVIFTNENINYTFEVEFPYEPSHYIYFDLFTIDKDFYQYIESMEKYSMNNGNPFGEPVQVFGNIENGYGLFTSFSYSSDSIFVE